jgi:hypothetical protein
VQVRAPESLEGDALSCYFDVSSAREFNERLQALRRAMQSGGIEKLFDELNR